MHDYPLLGFILLAGGLSLVVALGMARLATVRRRSDFAAMAQRLGLHASPNGTLPPGLSLNDTIFSQATALTNVYAGTMHGVEVAVLDFSKMVGRANWSRTVIAAKAAVNPFERSILAADMEMMRSGEWWVLYRATGSITPVEAVEARLKIVGRERV